MIEFAFDNLALLILSIFCGCLYFFFKWAKQFKKPSLFFPDIEALTKSKATSFKQKYSELPNICLYLAFSLLAIAFTDPHYFTLKQGVTLPENQDPPNQGIAIYLIADESGSMMGEVNAKSVNGRYEKMPKIDLLKQVTIPFIERRKSDLIGLIAFARSADVRSPLTLDHKTVMDEILQLKPSIDESDGGTAIGYAVYKTVNLIMATKHFAKDMIKDKKPSFEIKNAIVVLVTDGVQNVNPEDVNNPFRSMDISESAKYAKENNVRLYIINVDPTILTSKFTPERNLMNRVTDLTGGHFYVVDSSNSLSDIFADIDNIEKSEIKDYSGSKNNLPALYARVSFYPYFIAIAMAFLLIYVVLELSLFKRIP